MKKIMTYIVGLFSSEGLLADWDLDQDENRSILPIRPLILGGDDITFVCEGRLGVHLAEKLLNFMAETPINEQHIFACAGVAIVHTKYPFYKAYQLTEELLKQAKKESRNCNNGESFWLNYMISTGGFSGTLEDIINYQFTVNGNKKLKNGPYRVGTEDSGMQTLLAGMKHFQVGTTGNMKWPRNKIKDLRDALRRDQAYQSYFLAELDSRGLKLPNNGVTLWPTDRTPYYDMIELLDFYPENLIQ